MPSFRERPEYIAWKEAVFRRFGRQCVLCGHSGNIHAHHIKPVKQFPEKVFEVENGVPLCGNCHAEVTGKEAEYEERLVARQRKLDGKGPDIDPDWKNIGDRKREKTEAMRRIYGDDFVETEEERQEKERREYIRRLYGDAWPGWADENPK